MRTLGFGGNSPLGTSSSDAHRPRLHEPALLVQPEQQAPAQAQQRAAARRLPSGSDDQPARHLRLQLARRSRGEPAGVVHAHAARRASRAPSADHRRRSRSATRIAARATSRSSTACVSTRTASPPRRRTTRTSSSLFGARNDVAPNQLYVEPAHRLLVDATAPRRRSPASRAPCAARAPSCAAASASSRARRTRHPSVRRIDNTGLAERACSSSPASGSAVPMPDWSAYAADPVARSRRVRRRHARAPCSRATRRTSRCSRSDFAVAAQRALEPQLERPDPRQPLQRQLATSRTRANLNQASTLDLNFKPTRALHARRRGQPPGVRAADEHRAGDRRDRVARRAGQPAVQSRERAAERSAQRERSSSASASPRRRSASSSTGRSTTPSPTCASSIAASRARSAIRSPSTWSRVGGESRHQITYNLGYNFFDAVRVNWFGQFRSGTPFTPTHLRRRERRRLLERPRVHLRSGDARPIPPSPPRCATCSRAARARRRTASRASSAHLAARNCCKGPWTSSANLSISFNPLKVRHAAARHAQLLGVEPARRRRPAAARRRTTCTAGDSSPSSIRRCSTCAASTATAKRYKYEVNPRFGSTNPQFNAFRAPVTLTMQMRVDVGPSRERQQLTQMLDRGRTQQGQRTPEGPLKAHVRHGRHHEPDGADPSPERHARAHRPAGGQHRDA